VKDQVVLITGGSQGYGKAAAKVFADAGAMVVLAARGEETLQQAQMDTGSAGYICMDVTQPEDWENRALSYIERRFGRLDVLVNNAGGGVAIRELAQQTTQQIDAGIALNLSSVIYGSRTFAPMMKRQQSGTIINVASVCAKHAWPGWSVYAAAKWGVLGFSKNLYVELRPHGVRVTCLIPGAGATDFMKHAGEQNMRMRLQAEDIARTMLHICTLPSHVVVEEITVWGIDQAVVPL
jgi:NADP-dependent 3-hydroxy acid dehydrogenase YdfG